MSLASSERGVGAGSCRRGGLVALHCKIDRNFSKLKEARRKRSAESRVSVITNQLTSVISTQQAWTNFKDAIGKNFTETPKKFNKERKSNLELSPHKESCKKVPVTRIQLSVNSSQSVKTLAKSGRRNSRLELMSSLKEGMVIGSKETRKMKNILKDAMKVYKVLKDFVPEQVKDGSLETRSKGSELRAEANSKQYQRSTLSLLADEKKADFSQPFDFSLEVAASDLNSSTKDVCNALTPYKTPGKKLKLNEEKGKKPVWNEIEVSSRGKKVIFKVVGIQLNRNLLRAKENSINKAEFNRNGVKTRAE
eukprot:TRINITY_DN2617_c0_g5_i1.p1 TRINITY_DN2617_c0_g5~~TRINITY_DN2617_c0_g5_i1.p1  ORF type:complete len:308 (-),score=60.70 TRINITY_DN2617_c0_g5_i1:134-1057(-)